VVLADLVHAARVKCKQALIATLAVIALDPKRPCPATHIGDSHGRLIRAGRSTAVVTGFTDGAALPMPATLRRSARRQAWIGRSAKSHNDAACLLTLRTPS
jgi:hypothetical protein